MKDRFAHPSTPLTRFPNGSHASARVIVLVLAGALLGIAGSALWYQRAGKMQSAGSSENGLTAGALSDATKGTLATLGTRIVIHYYAILDPASTAEATQAFAQRVDQLLKQYEAEANSKLTVTRYTAASNNGLQAAAADSIKPFNLDKGDACYLGLAVLGNEQKEVFAQLSADWESALEADLSRAIARVNQPKPGPGTAAPAQAPDPKVIIELKAALPDLVTLTVEEGSTILREAAMKQAQTAMEEMKGPVEAAQKRLAETRKSGSSVEQQTALKEYEKAQFERAEKLKAITGNLQAQIELLKQLKAE